MIVLCLFDDCGPVAGDMRVAKGARGQMSPTYEGDMSWRLGPQRSAAPLPCTGSTSLRRARARLGDL